MIRTFSTTAIIALIAGAASADGLTYGYGSFDYSNFSVDGNEADISLLQGAVEYEINQFLLTGDVDHRRITDGASVDFTQYSVGAAFKATPEILAGVGLLGMTGDVGDRNGFEVFGQYQTQQFGVALNVTKPNNDFDNVITTVYGVYQATPSVTLGLSLLQQSEFDDTTNYELSAEYNEGPIDLRGYYDGFSDDDAGLLGFRGSYEVTPDIRVLADYQTLVGTSSNDINAYRIGGGYQFAETVWVDAFYGQVSFGGPDIDRIGLQLTFETGVRQRIDSTFNQNDLEDGQAGFQALGS